MRTLTIHSMGAGEDLLCFLLSDPHWLALPLFGAQLSLIPKGERDRSGDLGA